MSPKVPAPSKGALRALRRIALGTTCTIAFSTAVITEDRRRRIRAAHAANENGRKIKSLSRYHSSGAAVSAGFEEDVVRYGYFGPDPQEEVPRVLEVKWSDTCPVINKDKVDVHQKNPHSKDAGHQANNQKAHQHQIGLQYDAMKFQSQLAFTQSPITSNPPKIKPPHQRNPADPAVQSRAIESASPDKIGVRKGIWRKRAEELEVSLDVDNARVVDSVAETFFDLFHYEWGGRFLGKSVLDVLQKLSNACLHHQRIDTASKILQTVCQSTDLDEETFMSFCPEMILKHLTSQTGFRSREAEDGSPFEQAVALFCPKLKKKPELQYPNMATIGRHICNAAFHAKRYDIVDKIYWQTQAWCPGTTTIHINTLILAQQKLENHKKVVDYFIRLSPKAGLDLEGFVAIAQIALKSSLSLDLPKTEAVLHLAAETLGNQSKYLPLKMLIKVLKEHWKVTRNFTTTKALFESLEKHVKDAPARLYGFMIHICIEANHLDDINEYIERCSTPLVSDASTGWIRGYLALSKGKIGDWTGVEDDFKEMYNQLGALVAHSKKERQRILRASFIPNLNLFIKSHGVTETEEFLHHFIDNYGLVPNQSINNMMIGVYVQANELESIPPWLKYAQSQGLDLDATSFNILLGALITKWGVPHSKLRPMYTRVKELDESLVNDVTLRLVGASAIKAHCVRPQIAAPKIAKRALTVPRDSHAVKYAMKVAMSNREFWEALEIYRIAKRNNIWLPHSVLDLAIEAVNHIGGDGAADEITDLLADAQRDGQDVTQALSRFLVHQIREADEQGIHVNKLFLEADMKLAQRGLSFPLQVVTEAIAILVQRGKFRAALGIWTSTCERPDTEPYKLDLPILTVLLQAHVGLSDSNGIRWVIKTLIDHGVRSDEKFRRVLRDALKSTKRELEANPNIEYLEVMSNTLVDCLKEIHQESVVPAIQAAKEAQKMVLDIMEQAGARVNSEQSMVQQTMKAKRARKNSGKARGKGEGWK